MEQISSALIQAIRAQYTLPWRGTHGITHWARVREAGLRLAARTGANLAVVELFAVLHDARRRNEGVDPGHGGRGADFAATLRGTLIHLAQAEFALLHTACADHTKGLLDADITIQTCWDADRLDLGRVGTTPDPARLCTAAARDPDMIRWAGQRSGGEYVPPVVDQEWDGGRRTRR
jgi:uncharacterized protein